MTQGVETRLDGETLVVRIPMRFQRRGGRKRIVAPDGNELAPVNKPQPDGTLMKALARAWRWQRMLDEGLYTSVSEIGDAENISKSYVSRILRLALLAPDLVQAVLAGTTDQALMLEKLERPLAASWEEQRRGLFEADIDCREGVRSRPSLDPSRDGGVRSRVFEGDAFEIQAALPGVVVGAPNLPCSSACAPRAAAGTFGSSGRKRCPSDTGSSR